MNIQKVTETFRGKTKLNTAFLYLSLKLIYRSTLCLRSNETFYNSNLKFYFDITCLWHLTTFSEYLLQ